MKKEWFVEVDETEGDQLPDLPILVVSVNDADLLETNRFSYKVTDKQFGADKFTMVTNSLDGTGSLKVAKPLDFEDPQQRYGFNITISVSDHGGESNDPSHVDYAKVNIRLKGTTILLCFLAEQLGLLIFSFSPSFLTQIERIERQKTRHQR